MPLKEMEDRILRAMKRLNRPVTVKNIANELNVSGQSVRNYLPRLMNAGRVEIYSKRMIEGASAYVLTDESSTNFNPITWTDGDMIPVREILMKLAQNGFAKNPYWQNVEMIIAKLYTHALNAVDDSNPQTVSALQLREYRVRLEKLRSHAKNLIEATTDLLDFDEIWNPRTLPGLLVINDTKLDVEKARDLLDRLAE